MTRMNPGNDVMKCIGAEFRIFLPSAQRKVIPELVFFCVHTLYYTIAVINISTKVYMILKGV